MSGKEEIVLEALEDNIKIAPELGICSLSFIVLRDVVKQIIDEKDAMAARLAVLADCGICADNGHCSRSRYVMGEVRPCAFHHWCPADEEGD